MRKILGREKVNKDGFAMMTDNYTGGKVALRDNDRKLNTLAISPAGCGKTNYLTRPMIQYDINNDNGVIVIDQLGYLTGKILEDSKEVDREIIYFDAADQDTNIYYNPLKGNIDYVIDSLTHVFKEEHRELNQFELDSCVRLIEHYIILLKNMKKDNATLFDLQELINNSEPDIATEVFRNWLDKLANNKYLQKTINPGVKDHVIDIDKVLEQGQILLVNINTDKVKDEAYTLGRLIMLDVRVRIFKRRSKEKFINIYVDDFYNICGEELFQVLAQKKGYNVAYHLGITSIVPLKEKFAYNEGYIEAIMMNIRNTVVFPGIDEITKVYIRENIFSLPLTSQLDDIVFPEVVYSVVQDYNLKQGIGIFSI